MERFCKVASHEVVSSGEEKRERRKKRGEKEQEIGKKRAEKGTEGRTGDRKEKRKVREEKERRGKERKTAVQRSFDILHSINFCSFSPLIIQSQHERKTGEAVEGRTLF